jgi:hypothetical protein
MCFKNNHKKNCKNGKQENFRKNNHKNKIVKNDNSGKIPERNTHKQDNLNE